MSNGTIIRKLPPPSQSEFLHTVGLALGKIKSDERLTYEEMADKLDVHKDSLADYIAGRSKVCGLTLLRACNVWPEAFGKPVLALAMQGEVPSAADTYDSPEHPSRIRAVSK